MTQEGLWDEKMDMLVWWLTVSFWSPAVSCLPVLLVTSPPSLHMRTWPPASVTDTLPANCEEKPDHTELGFPHGNLGPCPVLLFQQ